MYLISYMRIYFSVFECPSVRVSSFLLIYRFQPSWSFRESPFKTCLFLTFLVTIFFEMAATFLMRMRMRDMQYAVRCWVKVKSRNAKLSYGARRLRLCVMYHAPWPWPRHIFFSIFYFLLSLLTMTMHHAASAASAASACLLPVRRWCCCYLLLLFVCVFYR